MSAIKIIPHIRVQSSGYDPASDEFESWENQLKYHIAANDETSNNLYVGSIIAQMLQFANGNPAMWWRIQYVEERVIQTTNEQKTLSSKTSVVSDVSHGQRIETFQDRNADGQCELNYALPIFEQYPRFLTEHDIVAQMPEPAKVEASETGDGATPGEEVAGEDEPDDTLHVSDGDVITVHDEFGHEQQLRISVV